MAVKIRLKRMGKIRAPFYRVVVMDSRTKRDGRAIEEIGKYHPTEEPSLIDISSERALHWLGRGAQPTEAVEALLKVTGDWQKFKGIDGTEGTLRVKAPRTSKKELYEAAVAASGASLDTKDGATTPRKRAAKAAEPKAAETTGADARAAETKGADAKAAGPRADKAADPKAAEAKDTGPKADEAKVAEPEAAEPGAAEPEAAEVKAEDTAPAAVDGPDGAGATDASAATPAEKTGASDANATDTPAPEPEQTS